MFGLYHIYVSDSGVKYAFQIGQFMYYEMIWKEWNYSTICLVVMKKITICHGASLWTDIWIQDHL
jgi:hypothetical protein